MKNKVRIFIGLALIVFGVGLVLIIFKGKWDTKKNQDDLYEKFIHMDNNAMQQELSKDKSEPEEEYKYVDMVTPIAYMQIPKINLKVIVGEGTEDRILKYSVGHFKDTAFPGKDGNCALAGHRNFDTGEFFLKINKLAQGDDIIISDHDNTYTYKVTKSFEVAPDDTYILDSTPGESIVTLVTCTYDGSNRLVVQGKLDTTDQLN